MRNTTITTSGISKTASRKLPCHPQAATSTAACSPPAASAAGAGAASPPASASCTCCTKAWALSCSVQLRALACARRPAAASRARSASSASTRSASCGGEGTVMRWRAGWLVGGSPGRCCCIEQARESRHGSNALPCRHPARQAGSEVRQPRHRRQQGIGCRAASHAAHVHVAHLAHRLLHVAQEHLPRLAAEQVGGPHMPALLHQAGCACSSMRPRRLRQAGHSDGHAAGHAAGQARGRAKARGPRSMGHSPSPHRQPLMGAAPWTALPHPGRLPPLSSYLQQHTGAEPHAQSQLLAGTREWVVRQVAQGAVPTQQGEGC